MNVFQYLYLRDKANWKTKYVIFCFKFPFQYLDFSIVISKYWNENSKGKRSIFPVFHLVPNTSF